MGQSALRNVRSMVTTRWDISGFDTNGLRALATQRISQIKAELVLASCKHGIPQKQVQDLAGIVPQSISGCSSVVARKHQVVIICGVDAAQLDFTVLCGEGSIYVSQR
jgi:quinolinate synthase